MLKASIKRIRAHAETGLAVVNFGASSVYWLALAFFMSAPDYGKMMTIQASIMLVSTALTFRTHDLLFYLKFKRELPLERAFRLTLASEAVTTIAIQLACSAGALALYDAATAPLVMAVTLLIAIGTAQGASVAKLRYLRLGDRISQADIISIVAWIAAYSSFLLLPDHSPILMLLIGSMPNAFRTFALVANAWVAREEEDSPQEQHVPVRAILHFLGGAQITNFLKNGAISIETMILAAFLNPTSVAMYRLARSTQGATSAAINVEYQRSYSALSRSQSAHERRKILSSLNRRSILTCIILYPASAIFAILYAITKPKVGIITFQLITLGTFLSFIPAALQQGYFAALSLHGDHHSVNLAYLASMIALLALSSLLLIWPSMLTFIAAVLITATLRFFILFVRAQKVLAG